jgi:hypothetical protein
MKFLLVLLVPGLIFMAGRSSAPDAETHYKVLHRTKTVHVNVPGPTRPLPEDCRAAVAELDTVIPAQLAILKQLDTLNALTHDISVVTGQDQIEVNRLKIRAGDIQASVDHATMDMAVSQDRLTTLIKRCNLQTKE